MKNSNEIIVQSVDAKILIIQDLLHSQNPKFNFLPREILEEIFDLWSKAMEELDLSVDLTYDIKSRYETLSKIEKLIEPDKEHYDRL